jgi:predicted nucleotidyltransferase
MNLQSIHKDSLATSTALSGYYVENFIAPHDVIRILNNAAVRFMLVGAHGVGGWLQKPRASEDVDVLVAARSHKKAIKALTEAFPQLEVDDHPVVTRLRHRDTQKVIIDVMKPNQQLFREALKHTYTVQADGQSYQIPSLEMALAMKFAPMISLHRSDEDKFIDAHDFIYIVKANPDIDLEKLAQLGELVYPGGGEEIVEKVRQVRAGERLNL